MKINNNYRSFVYPRFKENESFKKKQMEAWDN